VSDFRTAPNPHGPTYRSQQEQRRDQLLGDLSQGLDVQHHNNALYHQFGGAFEAPTAVASNDPTDFDGFVGLAESPARSDHRHGYTSIPWTSIGAFINGWGNFGGGNPPVSFCVIQDFIYLRGIASGGTMGLGAFALPVGARPAYSQNFGTVSNGVFGFFNVLTSGVVSPIGGSNVWFSFDGTIMSKLG
jgi:hypothetical protein